MMNWNTSNIPSQQGRLAIVTGTGGLGFEDALELARAGAEVILAGRNPASGMAAVAQIRLSVPNAKIRFEVLDLADLASVTSFAARISAEHASLDLLINNAGVMTPPKRKLTADGFELQLGTNYLGHFALTAHLLPLLRKGKNPRVINLSSIVARQGAINFDDLMAERSYKPMAAYGQSKLACLMFAYELQRHSDANGWGIDSIAAHPGVARTDLLTKGAGKMSALGLMRTLMWFMFQPVAQGALPTLYAATASEAKGGAYYGPDKMNEMRGAPTIAKPPAQALDTTVAKRLWEVSEQLTGVRFA